ncbi:MAG: TonB-dependent receptor, partial [bacterium]
MVKYLKLFRISAFTLYPCLILIFVITSELVSQSNIRLTGFIKDEHSGDPVVAAHIEIYQTPYAAYSNEEGFFQFENIPAGSYRLRISSLGYSIKYIDHLTIYPDQIHRINVFLTPAPLSGDSVHVEADVLFQDFLHDGNITILPSKEIKPYLKLGLQQLLEQIPGLQVEATRGGKQGTTLRMHGGRANQVLVLLDGQRLNNPSTGEVDLGLIPLENIERIEISRAGNTAQYGANAFDGIINFRTKVIGQGKAGEIVSRIGSFSTASGGANARIGISSYRLLLNYQQDYSKQDFWYPYQGKSIQRQNAWYSNYRIFSKIEKNNQRNKISLFYHYGQGVQGLPSAFYEEMNHYEASSREQYHTINLNHKWLVHSKFYFHNMLGFHVLNQLFNNEEDPSPFTRYKSQQYNSTTEIKTESVYLPVSTLLLRAGVQFGYEYLNSENVLYPEFSVGKKSRPSYAVYSGLEWSIYKFKSILNQAQFRFSLRYERPLDLNEGIYPMLGVSFVPKYMKVLMFSAGWGKTIRYPDFNSLFWKGDARARGNPDLLPERKNQWNWSVLFTFPDSYLPSLNIYYYQENITDLIYWHRSVQGIWEPRNEDKVSKTGWDVQLDQRLMRENFTLKFIYSYIDAFNKSIEPNHFNKRVIFIPQHSFYSALNFILNPFYLTAVYRRVSEREVTAANTG